VGAVVVKLFFWPDLLSLQPDLLCLLLCADADPEVKLTPNPPSFMAMMLWFHILVVVHDWFI
jgi:hypothetical protein